MTKQCNTRLIRVGSARRDTKASFQGQQSEGVLRYNI